MMKSYTAIVTAAAMLQGAMAQGAEEKTKLGPSLDASDIARQVANFENACRQNSVGQIDGKILPFPCNAEVQIMSVCQKNAANIVEIKECLCRKNMDKKPSAFFEVAQSCVNCNRCNRLQTIAGAEYYSGIFNRVEEKFCSPENTETYDAIFREEDTGMPITNEFDDENTCIGKPINIMDYAEPKIQPWDAGGRFAKDAQNRDARDVNVPQAQWGNATIDGEKGSPEGMPVSIVPGPISIPVADQVSEVCSTVREEGDGQGVKYTDICFPLIREGCTVGGDGMTCSEATLRPDLANSNPSQMSLDWSFNITFAFAEPYTFPSCNCQSLPQPEKIEGNVIKGSNITVSDMRAESTVRNGLSVNTQFDIQIDNIFQQCPVCEEVKEAPEQPKTAPAQPDLAPLTPNKQTSAQSDEEDLSCEPKEVPTGGQAGSQPPVANGINVENKISIKGGGPSPGPSGPGNAGTTPSPPNKGAAPGPELQAEGGPAVFRSERAASEGEAPKKPMSSGVNASGVSVSTETTTRNDTTTTPSCKGPSCASIMVNGAGAFRASSVMVAAAALLVTAL